MKPYIHALISCAAALICCGTAWSQNQDAEAKPSRVEAVVITLRPNGFEPAAITRPKGTVFLVVNNRSGLHQLSLAFGRDKEPKSHAAKVPREKKGWRELLELTPGRYLLTETDHPEWNCTITVDNK